VAAGENMKALGGRVSGTKENLDDMAQGLRESAASTKDWGKSIANGLNMDTAISNLSDIDAKLKALGKRKPTPQVKADIKEWKTKRAQVVAEMARLRKEKATLAVDANTQPAILKLRDIPVPTANIPVDAHTAKANADIDHAARDRTSTIHVNYSTNTPGEHSGGRVGQTSIVPQLFGDARTVAGVRAAARGLSATPQVAVTGSLIPAQPRPGQGSVTQLAPRQTPIRIYLDGAEIADHLTLKAGRLATTSSVRRRA
jgi:hypothetical protein